MTKSEWAQRKADLMAQVNAWLGNMPPRGPVAYREICRREYFTHTEVKLTFEGEPGEDIPAYLLIPREKKTPLLPTIYAAHQCACLCDIGKEQVVGKAMDWPDQAYGLELVREGFVVLAPDNNLAGERCDRLLREPWQRRPKTAWIRKGTHAMWGQSICCTAPKGPAGCVRWKRVYDVMRGFDFLCELPYVDTDRMGMIGHSMGAGITLCAMPHDERIGVAVISGAGMHPAGESYGYGLEFGELLSIIAPRPLLDVTASLDNGPQDKSPLPLDARMRERRAAHVKAATIYAALGEPEGLSCTEFEGDHSFPAHTRAAAYEWLKRWLRKPRGHPMACRAARRGLERR